MTPDVPDEYVPGEPRAIGSEFPELIAGRWTVAPRERDAGPGHADIGLNCVGCSELATRGYWAADIEGKRPGWVCVECLPPADQTGVSDT